MRQNGFTLIETIVIIGLMSIMISAGMMTLSLVNTARFKKAVNEVGQALVYARQATVMTGQGHSIYCFSDRVLVRKGLKIVYTVDLGEEVYIPDGCTGRSLYFCDSMAVEKAGTIKLRSKTIDREADITVSVATSKVTIKYID